MQRTPAPIQEHRAGGRDWRVAGGAALLLAMLIAVGYWQRHPIARLFFYPSPVIMAEAYAESAPGATFEHLVFDGLLRRHVDPDGAVDYAGLRGDLDKLDSYIKSLANADLDKLGRDEKLALLINAYNAFTLRLILDHYPIASIKDIPAEKRWDARRWRVGTHTWSLNQIEHEQIRPKFKEPRIHFALVCAARGCPPLRNEAYAAVQIDKQLESQAKYIHAHDQWFGFEPATGKLRLTSLYDWYRGDFEQSAGTVAGYAARYSPALKAALDRGANPRVQWIDYDWSLNDRKQQP